MFWKILFVLSVLGLVIGVLGMLVGNEASVSSWGKLALGSWVACAITSAMLVLRQ